MIAIRRMNRSEMDRLGELDRSEHVTLAYTYDRGRLEASQVDWQVPRWSPGVDGPHTVKAMIGDCIPLLEAGGTMWGAFDRDLLVGVAIYRPELTPTMDQLALLHVSRDYRRRGIAARLTARVIRQALERGAEALYVSATPSQSAVGFYTSQGFSLADRVHPDLYALEPEDIHMIKTLKGNG